jgi:hypothetical protein
MLSLAFVYYVLIIRDMIKRPIVATFYAQGGIVRAKQKNQKHHASHELPVLMKIVQKKKEKKEITDNVIQLAPQLRMHFSARRAMGIVAPFHHPRRY